MVMMVNEEERRKIAEVLCIEYDESVGEQINVMAQALGIFEERNRKYGDLWKRFGWMGNLLHMTSKTARLEKVFWEGGGDGAMKSMLTGDDTFTLKVYDYDDAIDLINYTAFFIRNLVENNERGNR